MKKKLLLLGIRAVLVLPLAAASPEERVPLAPNRTLPKVTPPRMGLEFSVMPTVREISRARVFEEPLVPIGGEPSAEENAALADALLGYAKRSGPDDFSSLTAYLAKHSKSPWRASLLMGLGLEYYNTAHYSLALAAWSDALQRPGNATNVEGMVVLARAAEELASLYARLGRMTELETILKAYDSPGASQRIKRAQEALWLMQHRPETSFRCGPLALQCILKANSELSARCGTNALTEIFNSASTRQGFSLSQVADLSKKVGLNYQMAFRSPASERGSMTRSHLERGALRLTEARSGDFIIPSVVHWKVGHYAAMVRQVGDRYLLQDPTFGNSVWATKEALEAETSGYFLIPAGELPRNWRSVSEEEGGSVWGKGVTAGNDDDLIAANDHHITSNCSVPGMPVSSIHLMTANLSITDTPLIYHPPVGPPVRFTFRYNSRDSFTTERTFGGIYWNGFNNPNVYDSVQDMPNRSFFITPFTRMTHDWICYLVDSPQNPLANVRYFVGGGGARTFIGFDTNTQTFVPQQYDQTLLRRTGPNSYEMIFPNGSKYVFGQPNGSVGAGRRVYLTQMADSAGNALTFTYNEDMHVVAVTDAIGQVTTVTYGDATNAPTSCVVRVTDPFGRFALFEYEKRAVTFLQGVLRIVTVNSDGTTFVTFENQHLDQEYFALTNITDMLGLSSQPVVSAIGGDVTQVITPYGTNSFTVGGGGTNGNTRYAEISHPDGSRERVEYNQSQSTGIPDADPAPSVPAGMPVQNQFLYGRNTFYWNRTASASSYGDYSKAKLYHWLHNEDISTTSGILESTKEPLEGRVWYGYAGQRHPAVVGTNTLPTKIARVLDDGQTQAFTAAYNGFGHATNSVDPLGRTFTYLYATNGIDLLEMRQMRGSNNELLFRATYNSQHRPLTVVDAAGQTNTFTYNPRGQRLTATNPRNETTRYSYDADGYLIAVDGPLPGTNDVVTMAYDILGRVSVVTGTSGYRLAFNYDAMDRITRITHPDSTFEVFTYHRLDLVTFRDRAGRLTTIDYDNMRQPTKRTDPLGRVTLYDWCRCGALKSLTDPMGRTTTWVTDVQSRPIAKQYPDGSQVIYQYENTISRLHLSIDGKQQVTRFAWNDDNTLRSFNYANTVIPTPGVRFLYDPNYNRVVAMDDGTGRTTYTYNPVTTPPTLGAGALASIDGPLPNDTITFGYDELGRPIHRAIDGVDSAMAYDPAGRLIGVTNALGPFAYSYDGATGRLLTESLPNGQAAERNYGDVSQDLLLQRISNSVGGNPLSEFLLGHDVAKGRISNWSQQAGAQSSDLFALGYDDVDQLLSVTVTNGGNVVKTFGYTYDLAGNRLTEQVGGSNFTATYNALNEIATTTAAGFTRTNEWDAADRLVAVNVGNQRTEFTYDGRSRMTSIRHLVNGSEDSFRRFVWCGDSICEECNAAGMVTKRFFSQGVKLESGSPAGAFYYTRDHLGSIRELTDSSGVVRARYSYDPYGRRTKLAGDLEADFGFAGMFFSAQADLSLTHFRAYDAELGRWLSRDPLKDADQIEGPNLFAYVANDPVNLTDPLGLFPHWTDLDWIRWRELFWGARLQSAGEVIEVVDGIIVYADGEIVATVGEEVLEVAEEDIVAYIHDVPQAIEEETTVVRATSRLPRPGPPTRFTGISGAANVFVGAGVTILTMTDCDTVQGIFALYRQGNGGMANKYADKLMRDLRRQKLL